MEAIIEGILFLKGEEGASFEELKSTLEITEDELKKYIIKLEEDYKAESRGITIQQFGNIYKLVTKKEHKNYYEKLVLEESLNELSDQALETLAIIAYNEPITRQQIDDIRGVSSVYVLRKLQLKGLIYEIGRSDLPGRPILFGTTNKFLDYFGIKSKEELPKIEEKEIISDEEINLFESKYTEK